MEIAAKNGLTTEITLASVPKGQSQESFSLRLKPATAHSFGVLSPSWLGVVIYAF